MSNLNICYVCNGCGLYSTYGEKPFNKVGIDLSNYVLFSSGFIMKNPNQDLLFCNECFSKIKEGEIKIRNFGSTETMRNNISELIEELEKERKEFKLYKSKITSLLKKEAANEKN